MAPYIHNCRDTNSLIFSDTMPSDRKPATPHFFVTLLIQISLISFFSPIAPFLPPEVLSKICRHIHLTPALPCPVSLPLLTVTVTKLTCLSSPLRSDQHVPADDCHRRGPLVRSLQLPAHGLDHTHGGRRRRQRGTGRHPRLCEWNVARCLNLTSFLLASSDAAQRVVGIRVMSRLTYQLVFFFFFFAFERL